jgi:hypothetical protein
MSNVTIQLATGYLDVKDGSAFPINLGVAEIRDVSKRSGTTSKTITLSGTKNNHDLLNHYYDVNIQEGTFNINTLTECIVLQNGLPIIENAYIQLLAVNKKQNTASIEEEIEYEVMVKDSQADFFTKIDNKELSDIDFSDLDHTITAANVVASFSNTVTDGYKYILAGSQDNIYPLKEMRPAIYAKTYFDRIFEGAGFQYTWNTLTAAHFDKLVIPFNGDVINYDYTDYNVEETKAVTITSSYSNFKWSTFTSQIINWTEVLDNQNLFNPSLGEYVVPFAITGGDNITFTFDLEYDINAINSTGATAYLVDMQSSPTVKSYTIRPKVYVFKNGGGYITSGLQFTGSLINEGQSYANGTTNIVNNTTNTVSIPVSNLVTGDLLEFYYGLEITSNQTGNNQAIFRSVNSPSGGSNVNVNLQLDVIASTLSASISSSTLASGSEMQLNRYVPQKVKQKDFIKSIFTMYNLYTEVNPSEPNILILSHRDDYYDSGAETDWTYLLAKERDQVLQFLPELSSKKIVLTYKQDSDEPNKIYLDTVREVYGQVEFTFDNEYVKGVDTKELLFSPTPIMQTVFGAYVPMLAGANPKTNIRILHDGGVGTCQPYNIYDYGTTGQTNITTYPIIHHWDDPLNPSFDINFATCDYYYYGGYEVTNNNLYNLYWRRTISQINTGKMLTAYFDLNEADIQSLRLNDKIRIDNSWWFINKVIDYDPNVKQLTKVELMSIDTEIDFVRFDKRPITYKPNKSQYNQAVGEIFRQRSLTSNTYGQGSDVLIKGINNTTLPSTRGFIEGDGNILEQDGIITTTEGQNFANTDLTFDDNRNHDQAGYYLLLSNGTTFFIENPVTMIDNSSSQAALDIQKDSLTDPALRLEAINGVALKIVDGGLQYRYYLDANPTVNITTNYHIVEVSNIAATVNLPTAVGYEGLSFVIKYTGTGTATVDGNGTETIDGATTRALIQNESIEIVSNGSNWLII